MDTLKISEPDSKPSTKILTNSFNFNPLAIQPFVPKIKKQSGNPFSINLDNSGKVFQPRQRTSLIAEKPKSKIVRRNTDIFTKKEANNVHLNHNPLSRNNNLKLATVTKNKFSNAPQTPKAINLANNQDPRTKNLNFQVIAEIKPDNKKVDFPIDINIVIPDKLVIIAATDKRPELNRIELFDLIEKKTVYTEKIKDPSGVVVIGQKFIFAKTNCEIVRFELVVDKNRKYSLKNRTNFMKLPGMCYGLKIYQDHQRKIGPLLTTVVKKCPKINNKFPGMIFICPESAEVLKTIVIKTRNSQSQVRFFSNFVDNICYVTCLKCDDIYKITLKFPEVRNCIGLGLRNKLSIRDVEDSQIFYGNQEIPRDQKFNRFWQIAGPSIDEFGNVLVADSKNFRIVFFDKKLIESNFAVANPKIYKQKEETMRDINNNPLNLVRETTGPKKIKEILVPTPQKYWMQKGKDHKYSSKLMMRGITKNINEEQIQIKLDPQRRFITDIMINREENEAYLTCRSNEEAKLVCQAYRGKPIPFPGVFRASKNLNNNKNQIINEIQIGCFSPGQKYGSMSYSRIGFCPECWMLELEQVENDIDSANPFDHRQVLTKNDDGIKISGQVQLKIDRFKNYKKWRPSGINLVGEYLLIGDLQNKSFIVSKLMS